MRRRVRDVPASDAPPERLVRFEPAEWPPSRSPFLPGTSVDRLERHAHGDHSACDGPTDWWAAREDYEAANPDVDLRIDGHAPDEAWDPDAI